MAAKEKQIFFCKECGYESAKWQGQCPGCRAWNTFVEEKVKVGVKGAVKQPKDAVSPMGILQVTTAEESRVQTGMRELDRVLGGVVCRVARLKRGKCIFCIVQCFQVLAQLVQL